MSFFKDFKAFISRGNVVDMAVGVVVGGAFGKIVSSLVADLITPLISLLTKGVTLSEAYVCLNPNAVADTVFAYSDFPTVAAAQAAGYATLNYGAFIQTIVDFLLIALSIFCVIRVIAKSREKLESLKKKEEAAAPVEAPAEPAAPVETAEDILRDIRTMLAEGKSDK